jgi:hypothetical protein
MLAIIYVHNNCIPLNNNLFEIFSNPSSHNADIRVIRKSKENTTPEP